MRTIYTEDPVAKAVEDHRLGEEGIFTGSTANAIGFGQYQRRSNAMRASAPRGQVNVELPPAGKKFIALGLLLFGVWISPAVEATGKVWILPGLFLALGTYSMIIGLIDGWGSGWHPFEKAPGFRNWCWRFLWAFRPRIWVLAWVVIIGIFMGYGSPHLRIQYSPSSCDYFGLNGWESYGVSGNCPLIKNFRLH